MLTPPTYVNNPTPFLDSLPAPAQLDNLEAAIAAMPELLIGLHDSVPYQGTVCYCTVAWLYHYATENGLTDPVSPADDSSRRRDKVFAEAYGFTEELHFEIMFDNDSDASPRPMGSLYRIAPPTRGRGRRMASHLTTLLKSLRAASAHP